MDSLESRWIEQARGKKILLADYPDSRAVIAAERLARMGLEPIMIGDKQPSDRAELAHALRHLDQKRRLTRADADLMLRDPLVCAGLMLRVGQVDGCVAGATRPTGEVVRAAILTVGVSAGTSVVSSSFLMVLADKRVVAYGDCAIVPYPNASQLADIAISTAQTYETLVGERPVVAMLSFSTKGSASHASVHRVQRATELVRKRAPDLEVDGELQFDSAWVPSIGASKAPLSRAPGRANVFIFPNLDAGNIAYKITERLAGARAYGPLLQGLARPLHDLSRGASASDMVTVAAICGAQAAASDV